MATFYGTGVGGNYPERMTIKTVATIVSQNAATNSSIINLKVYAYYNYDKYNTVNPTSGFQYIQIDKSESSTVYDFSSTQNFDYAGTSSTNTVKIMDWTSGSIAHNSDGTKTVNVKVYQACPGVSTLTHMYDEFDWTLDTIPRASVPTLSASSVALGGSVTIYTNRVSTAFTHTINYKLGTTTSETQVATSVTTSHAWTLPATLANSLASSTSGTLTFYVHTYSGGTLIGTKTITMTVTIPNNSTYQPSVSLAIAEATAAMVGAGFWLAGKSAIKATTTATGKYSATISKYAVNINGSAYASAVSTGGVITTTGSKTVSVTVTDSRGLQATASTTANFISLPAPTRSASSVVFGNSVTIYTNRPTTAVDSTLSYAVGSIGKTQIVTDVGASYLWTIPKTAIGGVSNATAGIITITQDFYNGTNLLGSTTVTLTGTIPKSLPTANVSTVALGGSVTVYTNRAHTTLTHKLYYQLGSSSLTLIANMSAALDSQPWATTSALASYLPTAKSGTVTFTLDTYNGLVLVGSATKTITATIPKNGTYEPTVSATLAEGTSTMVGAGAYIAGHSSIKVTSTGTGKLGATISSYAVTINGSAYSGSVVTSSVIASSGAISVSVTVTDSRGYTGTYSTSVPFVAIAAPTFNLSSVALGGGAASAVTITTNRASTAITHTLKYAYGILSGTIGTSVGASTGWTLLDSLAGGFPSAKTGTVTITQESYFGARLLGTKTATFTATIPDIAAFRPVPAIASITEGAAGLSAFTVFIQGKSKLTVASTATYKYGATFAKYDVTINGVPYIGTPVTSGVINAIGNIDITVKVTDSRGYTGTITTQRAFVAYSPPQLTAFSAVRDQEVNLSTPINYSISPVSNQNSKSYLIEYRPTGGAWVTAHTNATLYTLNTTLTAAGVLSNSSSYEVRLTLSDSFVNVVKTILIGTGFSLMDFRSTGKGIAFGKVSEKDELEVAMPFSALKGIAFQDTRSAASEPQAMPPRAISFDFKSIASVGNPPVKASDTYAHILTVAGWNSNEGSGGWPSQISVGADGLAVRQATSATAWGPWKNLGAVSAHNHSAADLTSGTVPDARLTGTYSGFTHKIDGSNTVYTTPSSGTTDAGARTVFGLAEYRSSASAQIGAIVFIQNNTTSSIMYQFSIAGMLYNQNIFTMELQGYRTTTTWSALKKISTGTVDVQTRFGVTPDGKNCIILGDVGTSWSYPHISIIRAMFSHSGASDAICSGWKTAIVTSLTGYTNVTANIADSAMVGSISGNAGTATKLATARTISLTGDVTGSVSFDGSGNAAITATVADDSHNHTTANIDGLVTALAGKLSTTGTAADSSKLNGVASSEAATASTIVKRSSAGYVFGAIFNDSWTAETSAAGSYIYKNTGDGYHRSKPLASVRTEIVTKAAVEAALTGNITTHSHQGTITSQSLTAAKGWTKFSNGYAKTWHTVSYTIASSEYLSLNTNFRTNYKSLGTFPLTFTSAPVVQITSVFPNEDLAWEGSRQAPTTTSAGGIQYYRTLAGETVVRIYIEAYGPCP